MHIHIEEFIFTKNKYGFKNMQLHGHIPPDGVMHL